MRCPATAAPLHLLGLGLVVPRAITEQTWHWCLPRMDDQIHLWICAKVFFRGAATLLGLGGASTHAPDMMAASNDGHTENMVAIMCTSLAP